jgi:HEAT repeat protein
MIENRKEGSPIEPTATLEEIVAHLTDCEQPLSNVHLAGLNDLKVDELFLLEQNWPLLNTERRRQIVSRLIELSEDNTRLNFDALLKSLLNDCDATIRRLAIEGLWENTEPSLVRQLAEILEGDDDTEVRAAAATALGRFATIAALDELRPDATDRMRQVLLDALGEKNPTEVRRRALEAVSPLNLESLNESIKEAYISQDVRFKSSAIYAMGTSCNPIWLPILIAELESDKAETRYEAANACGELAEPDAVPYLIKLIDDRDTEVQLKAVQVLGKIGGGIARKALKQCLEDHEGTKHQVAAEALAELEADENGLSFSFDGKGI